ncbi:unnamed protein product, partial [Phaeothamnion confervicola]
MLSITAPKRGDPKSEKAITAHHRFDPEPLFTTMKFIGSSRVVLVAPLLADCVGIIVLPRLPLLSPMWRKGECSNIFSCSPRSNRPRVESAAPSAHWKENGAMTQLRGGGRNRTRQGPAGRTAQEGEANRGWPFPERGPVRRQRREFVGKAAGRGADREKKRACCERKRACGGKKKACSPRRSPSTSVRSGRIKSRNLSLWSRIQRLLVVSSGNVIRISAVAFAPLRSSWCV